MTPDTDPITIAFHDGTVVVSEELTPDDDNMLCENTPRIVVDVRINEYLFAPGEGAHWSFCLDFDQAVRPHTSFSTWPTARPPRERAGRHRRPRPLREPGRRRGTSVRRRDDGLPPTASPGWS